MAHAAASQRCNLRQDEWRVSPASAARARGSSPCQRHSSRILSRELGYVNIQASASRPDGRPGPTSKVAVKTALSAILQVLKFCLQLCAGSPGPGRGEGSLLPAGAGTTLQDCAPGLPCVMPLEIGLIAASVSEGSVLGLEHRLPNLEDLASARWAPGLSHGWHVTLRPVAVI